MVTPNFLLILVNCLLVFFYSHFAISATKPHHAHIYQQSVAHTTAPIAIRDPSLIDSVHHEDPQLTTHVLDLAMHAVKQADAKGVHHRSVMAIIDYSLASTQDRMWIIDLKAKHILFHSLVAHGRSTGENLAKHFSNLPGSQASSIGLFLTKDTYFGHHGKSLRLEGLEPGYNSNALSRAIVIHGANYVDPQFAKSHGRIGRSWGCPAVPAHLAQSVVSKLQDGALVFAYFPDSGWLKHSKYLA